MRVLLRQRIRPAALAVLLSVAAAGVSLVPSAGAAGSPTPAADCQPFSSTPCLLPFPNNLFTRKDASTPTGLRVQLPAKAMPANTKGARIRAPSRFRAI